MKKKSLLVISLLLISICLLLSSCEYNMLDNKFYQVTFDSKGGSSIEPQIIIEGMTAVKPVNPTKEGFEFVGWFTENKTVFSFSTRITNDITLSAQWKSVGGNAKKAEKENIDLKENNTFEIEKLKTTVFVPSEAIASETTDNLNAELSVTTYDIILSNSKFEKVEDEIAIASFDFSLYLTNDTSTIQVTEFNDYITVTTYITKGLDKVSVKYHGEGNSAIASAEETDGTADIYATDADMDTDEETLGYSQESGLLRFKTNHFSEYYVMSDAEVYIEEDDLAMKLDSFSTSVENGNTYEGKTITLLKDLDYSSVEWDPIGLYNSIEGEVFEPFSGTFDGNNHTVKYKISEQVNYASLFACIENATIKNLKVSADIVNELESTTTDNNKCNSSIIVGYATGKNEISNCSASGSIKIKYDSKSKAAGIVAKNDGEITITNCTNEANISNSGLYTSGIIGESQGVTTEGKPYNFLATVKNCKNTGTISNTLLDGNDPAEKQYPTIVAYAVSSAEVYLIDCSDESEIDPARDLAGFNNSANKVVVNGELIYKRVVSIEEADGKDMKFYKEGNDTITVVNNITVKDNFSVVNNVTALVTYYDGTFMKVSSEDFASKGISVASKDSAYRLKIDKTYSEATLAKVYYLTLCSDIGTFYIPLGDYETAQITTTQMKNNHTWAELVGTTKYSFKIGEDSYTIVKGAADNNIYLNDGTNNFPLSTDNAGNTSCTTATKLNKRTVYSVLQRDE